MKNIKGWSDWYIHPFTLLYFFCACLVGYQKQFIEILFVVCFHELGHYLVAKHYCFIINKVLILPFGAFLQLDDFGYKPVKQELLVVLGGLGMHVFLFMIPNPEIQIINKYVFLFNLLPIYPLDGSKIVLLMLSYWLDYKKAILLQINISLFIFSIFIICSYNISYIVIYGYLFYNILLYSYHYPMHIRKVILARNKEIDNWKKKINGKTNFYRPYHNFYYTKGRIISEKEYYKVLLKQ